MTTVASKFRLIHKLLAACVVVAGLAGATLAATPAQAHDGWYGHEGWRGHEWREHEWREHHWRPYGYGYGYYRAPGYYYAPPPPVVYAPPPPAYYAPPQASFNVVVPFHF